MYIFTNLVLHRLAMQQSQNCAKLRTTYFAVYKCHVVIVTPPTVAEMLKGMQVDMSFEE